MRIVSVPCMFKADECKTIVSVPCMFKADECKTSTTQNGQPFDQNGQTFLINQHPTSIPNAALMKSQWGEEWYGEAQNQSEGKLATSKKDE